MHLAVNNNKEVVSLLLKKGTRLDTVDNVSVCMIVICRLYNEVDVVM